MHIVFSCVTNWQVTILKILKYLGFEVFYLHIDASLDVKKRSAIAEKLKKNNIFPIPIEFQKKISSNVSFSLCNIDPNEIAYKKNMEILPDHILKKYSRLFSISEKKVKKLRLLVQDFISFQQLNVSGHIGIWAGLNPEKKIIYVSFKFKCFYNSDTGKNIFKIIIPLNIFLLVKKLVLKLNLFTPNEKYIQEHVASETNNNQEISNKEVAFLLHRGLTFGTEKYNLYEKNLYYSGDINSPLNKNNILHLEYTDCPKPKGDICWLSLDKIKFSKINIIFKTIIGSVKTLYLIRGCKTFLGWILIMNQYYYYNKYCEIIKNFKNLKIAIIDYEALCPKTLIFAFEKNNIKTIATQERFIHTFFKSFVNVTLDTYYASSEFTANYMKKSKYHDIKNIIAIGQYRSDYIPLYKQKNIPEEIFRAKNNGKKIIILLGYTSSNYWFDSYYQTVLSWSAQLHFLEDALRLSKNLKNTHLILRYKSLHWTNNLYYKNIFNRINDSENITLSDNYKEKCYSYKLCANADLIIAKQTSIADECLAHEIPVLFHDYTHNMQNIASDAFDYSPSGIVCYNFEELLEKSKSILFDSSSKLKEEISKLNKEIYHVEDKGNIKKKISNQLENIIQSV
jgi:hypothetical protein